MFLMYSNIQFISDKHLFEAKSIVTILIMHVERYIVNLEKISCLLHLMNSCLMRHGHDTQFNLSEVYFVICIHKRTVDTQF